MDVLLLSIPAFFASLLFYKDSPQFQVDILRCGREFINYALIILAASANPKRIPALSTKMLQFYISVLIIVTASQAAYSTGHSPINTFIPLEYFAFDTGTVLTDIAAEALANGYESILRASAFYSEPSYLGFVCLCIYVMLHKQHTLKANTKLAAMLLAICLLAKTASGILILLAYFYIGNRKSIRASGVVIFMVVSASLIILITISPFVKRVLDSGNSSEEYSGYIRLVYPLKVISAVMQRSTFGVPLAELNDFAQAFVPPETDEFAVTFDNGVANVFIFYGIFGIVIWGCIARVVKNINILFFIIFCGLYNGTLFGYDKTALIVLSCIAYQKNNINIEGSGLLSPAYVQSKA